uniref:Uncharacterized protein n=1 Tax=Panagrolaimus sp. ES5 TaxID=591445 RepID=A0AC34GKZ4_9BILA
MKKMEMKEELFASIAPPPRYAPPQSNKPSFDRSNSWRNTTQPFGSHMTCTFCDREHSSTSCRTFTSPEQRIKQLRLKKRCINCMGQGHDANRCSRTDLRCKHCQQPHYAFLCEKGSYQVKSRAMICINKNQSSLLTKKVNVTNVDSNVTVPATLFFDS